MDRDRPFRYAGRSGGSRSHRVKTRTWCPASRRAGARAEIKVAGPPVSGGKMEVTRSSRARAQPFLKKALTWSATKSVCSAVISA